MSNVFTTRTTALPTGTVCWIDLATSNEVSAQRFYSALFGWTYRFHLDPATKNRRYLVAAAAGRSASGLYQANPSEHHGWILQLAVANVVNAARRVEQLGGTITLPPVTVPHRGNIFHALEPTGAPVAFWQPLQRWEFESGKPNTFIGADLNTHDGPLADRFFGELLHYRARQIGDGGNIDYSEWCLGGRPMLYRYVMGSEYQPNTPPHWMVYFSIDPASGVDEVAQKAEQLGGTIVIEPYN